MLIVWAGYAAGAEALAWSAWSSWDGGNREPMQLSLPLHFVVGGYDRVAVDMALASPLAPEPDANATISMLAIENIFLRFRRDIWRQVVASVGILRLRKISKVFQRSVNLNS